MSLTFKLLSLAIRTAAKPIGNYIKRQAKEHDGFRRFAIRQAQRVHWVDMRMRLGILHDPEAQERMYERERKRAEEKKRQSEAPTVRTAEEQKKFDEDATKEQTNADKKEKKSSPNIRPLSEAKAIELGANFFSEAFIFGVAAGLLIWDSWRSRRKESARRDDVKERLGALESEVDRLRSKYEPGAKPLLEKSNETSSAYGWYNPRSWWTKTDPAQTTEVAIASSDLEASVNRNQKDGAHAIVVVAPTPKVKPSDEKDSAKTVQAQAGTQHR